MLYPAVYILSKDVLEILLKTGGFSQFLQYKRDKTGRAGHVFLVPGVFVGDQVFFLQSFKGHGNDGHAQSEVVPWTIQISGGTKNCHDHTRIHRVADVIVRAVRYQFEARLEFGVYTEVPDPVVEEGGKTEYAADS